MGAASFFEVGNREKDTADSGNVLLKNKKSVPTPERLKLLKFILGVERFYFDVFVAQHVFEHVFDAAFEGES